jgi:hypothetical protein
VIKSNQKIKKKTWRRFLRISPSRWKSFDYVCGFFYKAASYVNTIENSASALVSTNSVTQGVQVAEFWPTILETSKIFFARKSFKWSNLAANNAGVICVVIGICSSTESKAACIFEEDVARKVDSISPYMIAGSPIYVKARSKPLSNLTEMMLGNFAKDGGNLFFSKSDIEGFDDISKQFIRPIYGAQEFIKGIRRFCFWITDDEVSTAKKSEEISKRFNLVSESRAASTKAATVAWSSKPHRFVEIRSPEYTNAILVPRVSSEGRDYLPVGLLPKKSVVTEAFALYDVSLWHMALIASRLHLVWIATVCGKMKTDFRYSNTLGWNTFPVPTLTEKTKKT